MAIGETTENKRTIIILPISDLEILKAATQLMNEGFKEPTAYQISKRTGRTEARVKSVLERLDRDVPRLRRFILAARKIRYFKKRWSLDKEGHRKLFEMIKEKSGYLALRKLPFGYKPNASEEPEEAKKVRQIFTGRIDGKSISQLSDETKLKPTLVAYILRNKFYQGDVHHKAIIDSETWKRAQQTQFPEKTLGWTRPPFAYKIVWPEGRIEVDLKKAKKVSEVFKLRLQGLSLNEIRKKVGLPEDLPPRILKQKAYMGLEGVPRIVDPETWHLIQCIPKVTSKEALKIHAQRMRLQGEETKNAIKKHLPGHTNEIARKIHKHPSTVSEWLHRMEKNGEVKSHKKRFGVWEIA